MEFAEAVAKVIRRRRLKSGLPQRELAYLCGLDPMTVSRIEQGKYPPSLATFWLLAKGLRWTAAELATEIDKLTTRPDLYEKPPPPGYRKIRKKPKTAVKKTTRKAAKKATKKRKSD